MVWLFVVCKAALFKTSTYSLEARKKFSAPPPPVRVVHVGVL